MKFNKGIGSIIVDVSSRFATRSLIINLEYAQIRWNWEESVMKLFEAKRNRWIHYLQPEGKAQSGYNKNIIEEMYIDEMNAFIKGLDNPYVYPNKLENDLRILKLLDEIELSDGGFPK
ncbi:MAG: hypothetical protein ACTSRZ_17805 [Promethearchaeota archaeon]